MLLYGFLIGVGLLKKWCEFAIELCMILTNSWIFFGFFFFCESTSLINFFTSSSLTPGISLSWLNPARTSILSYIKILYITVHNSSNYLLRASSNNSVWNFLSPIASGITNWLISSVST
jgi:hypothetical protein